MQSVFRFAPSPNGYLHLGHAYSALLNHRLAQETAGRLLLRIEDIDTVRCRPELVQATFDDLRWLGLAWEEPVLRQSQHFSRYRAALETLDGDGLLYPCFCSRSDIQRAVRDEGGGWPRDPDGAPLYPGVCRGQSAAARAGRIAAGEAYSLRIDMRRALEFHGDRITWQEHVEGTVALSPAIWGDAVLARKDMPTSYHLAVVVDDALQGVTDVVRGRDLYAATAVHRLLQGLLGLATPRYRHHDLLRDADGQKLAKSKASTPLRKFRAAGVTAAEIWRQLGFEQCPRLRLHS